MVSKKICYACDLVDNPELIELYKRYHAKDCTWPEITKSIKDSGIIDMEIYLFANRLFMIMEVDESYTPERKQMMDAANPKVQEWEELMSKFQQQLPNSKPGEKWKLMDKVFSL